METLTGSEPQIRACFQPSNVTRVVPEELCKIQVYLIGLGEYTLPFFVNQLGSVTPNLALALKTAIRPIMTRMTGQNELLLCSQPAIVFRKNTWLSAGALIL